MSVNASVKYAFKKWRETTRASNQRPRAGSTITIDTSHKFEDFDRKTLSDSEDDMSSSVTTSSSIRYDSKISINHSRRSSVTNSNADSWSSNGGEDYGDEDDDEYEDGEEEDDDNGSFKSFEGVHIHTPEEDEDYHDGSRVSFEAGDNPLPSDVCDDCHDPPDVGVLSWCNICCIALCDNCWTTQAAHKNGPRSRVRNPRTHEKTDLRLWEIINSILNPETDSKKQEQLHRDNFDTKWFGVEFDDNTRKPCFHDYGRYVKLASETDMEPGTQHPSITCFVGETGHGKSTLINALMKINRHTSLAPDQVPVMGTSKELDFPTSDAVHLFADPITYNTNRPYFYADCEGLSGGNKVPMATRAYQGVKNFRQKRRHARNDVGENGITWARGPEKSRQWMVENLYPRVLFTFSDVVCFVTRNFRALESVISKLIRWADKVFQQSVNQPVLPYAVIVVNALEVSDITSSWWDIDATTGDQLKKRADCIRNDPFMMKCVEKWRNLGKTINNLEELLMCYYSGIKIVCIPHAKESPAVIEQQYKVLYRVMEEGSQKAYDLRIKAGLLMTSEELDIYLRHAFHHFSKNPSKPFNFLAAAFHHNPVSSTFKDHIAKAAVHIMTQSPQMSGTDMFKLLAPLVASCILLDAFRSRYPHGGQAATIFPLYQQFCDDALAEVYEKHWRCEKRDRKGRRCANVATGHSKGHQLENGKVFAVGEFISAYIENASREKESFINTISSELDRLLKEFSTGQGISIVAQYHQNHVLSQYVRYWDWKGNTDHEDDKDIAPLTAHTTCFSCLSGTPIHALTCGHIICERCAENYSTVSSSGFWREIRVCPLCSNMKSPWNAPWKYKIRPKHTGPRILSLDGGGIRGIIQLKMLEALERKINLGVPIQDFFDLVVGTSSGGIIALALASNRVSVTECINLFCEFSEQAFQKRTGADLPGIKTLVEATYHSKYETRGIDRVLKEKLGDESIFGGKREPGGREMLRAGVTTISSSGHPYLVANYNRPLAEDLKTRYNFLRAENSHQELKTWEAARATSASPRFFKPFFHKPTGYSFNDGGLKFNNPVVVADQEWKLLWPNLANKHPDILLSIGTGYDPNPKPEMDKGGRRLRAKRGALEFAKVLLKIATQQIESSVGCEQTWSNFLRSLPIHDEDKAAKYHRLNIDLPNKLPRIDQVDHMALLRRAAEDFCYNNPLIDQISTKLIASLFYFRLDGASRMSQGMKWDCEGTILCRLEPGSDALRRLCKRLETRRNGPHLRNHLFFINEKKNSRGTPDQQLIAGDSLFENVIKGKPFEMKINFSMFGPEDSMRIFLSLSDKECDVSLISGFPCRILKEHEGYRPLARMDSTRTQRGHKSKTPSFYSAVSANSSVSSLSGIFRGVVTKAATKHTQY